MISAQELSSLLAVLYSAPLEPENWQIFMGSLCETAGISCGYLIGVDPGVESTILLAGGGTNFAPEMFQLYNEYYAAQDPYREPVQMHARVGSILDGDALYDRDELVQSEIYNDFLSRYELERTNVLIFNCNPTELKALSMWRSPKQGVMDEDSRDLLATLFPHVQNALRLRAGVLTHDASQVFSEAVFEALSAAAFLVSGDGIVRHMNRRASAYLGKEEVLNVRHGRLVAGTSQETAQLGYLIRAAASTNLLHTSELVPGGAMRVLRRSTRSPIHLTVIPVPARNTLHANACHALVFISEPNSGAGSRAALMRQLYGLSPTECRVADLLLSGLEVKQAADGLRITLETARFHVKRVLAKTGVRKQSELLRLMLSLPASPVDK